MSYPIPKNPGLLQEPFDPRDLWEDELGGTEVATLPDHFKIGGLKFEHQDGWPFCVSFATTSLMEWKGMQKDGVVRAFSQPHLFYQSGGSKEGSYVRANLETARNNGAITYSDLPMPSFDWSLVDFFVLQKKALAIPFEDGKKILGYVRVMPDRDVLKKAIIQHGPLIVGVAAGSRYWDAKTKRSSPADNHAVLLVGWEKDNSWIIFDSLQGWGEFDGYHTLSSDYTFNMAYAITELPENWRDLRDKKRSWGFLHCLDHYGQPRNFELEQQVAAQLLVEFRRLNNQSVMEAAGRFWTVYINAVCYGGYNISYKKWGRWKNGDVINDCFKWRRTGQHEFDFNRLRNEHP